jgi:hypothetical protein
MERLPSNGGERLRESKHQLRPHGMIAAVAAAVASLVAFAALGGVGVGQSAIGAAQYAYGKKITICHKAGPKKSVTITVSVNAWPAHSRHGDTLGQCQTQAAAQNKGKGKGKGKAKGTAKSKPKPKPSGTAQSTTAGGRSKGKGTAKPKPSGTTQGTTAGGRSNGNGSQPAPGNGASTGKGKGNGRK